MVPHKRRHGGRSPKQTDDVRDLQAKKVYFLLWPNQKSEGFIRGGWIKGNVNIHNLLSIIATSSLYTCIHLPGLQIQLSVCKQSWEGGKRVVIHLRGVEYRRSRPKTVFIKDASPRASTIPSLPFPLNYCQLHGDQRVTFGSDHLLCSFWHTVSSFFDPRLVKSPTSWQPGCPVRREFI